MKISKKTWLIILIVIIIFIAFELIQNWPPFYSPSQKMRDNLSIKNNELENNINSQGSNISSYIGLTYPPDPEGVISDINKDRYLGGAAIMKIDYSDSTPYSLKAVKTPNGYELWLDKLIDRDSSGKPKFIITDSLLISKEEISSYIFGGLCGKEDSLSPNAGLALDSTIVAHVDLVEYYSKGRAPALFAWKTNLETEKYEVYSPDGVFCIDPGAGEDTN